MKYDVFISYSRADKAIADQICQAFDEVGITYFIDRKGIGAAREFPDIIAQAIKECRKMLFLASKSAYRSKFTKREIYYAFKVKNEGDIMPYCIDDAAMPDNIDFVFCTINYRNIVDHPIKPVLVNDMLQLLGDKSVDVVAAKTSQPDDEVIYPDIADLPDIFKRIDTKRLLGGFEKGVSAVGKWLFIGLSIIFMLAVLLIIIMVIAKVLV